MKYGISGEFANRLNGEEKRRLTQIIPAKFQSEGLEGGEEAPLVEAQDHKGASINDCQLVPGCTG